MAKIHKRRQPILFEEFQQEVILKVENLSVNFTTDVGTVQAVKNISFEIHKGETVGIVGESGSGKSVTALSLLRLIDKSVSKIEGKIWFKSRRYGEVDLLSLSEYEMNEVRGDEIAMIFQEPMSSLNPVYTCGEQVMEAIILHQKCTRKQAKQRTLELFEKVKLRTQYKTPEDFFKAYPHELSGGQKQRVMIAMALSCNPKVLIADEPTTALDVTVQATILELLHEIRNEFDTSIIFITHDLGVIAEIADRVIVMYQGKIMEVDSTFNIFDNPHNPYTKGLLACRPRLDIKMRVLPVVSDFMEVAPDGTIVEKADHKYNSVGDALLFNFLAEDEIIERNKELAKQTPILEVKNLKTYFYKNRGLFARSTEPIKAVDDVSFVVYPGETVGLVGESGCGKTTLGRSILRLVEPTSGEIIFNGKNIIHYDSQELRKLRKDIQIIFQDPYSALNPRITIGSAILEPMRLHKIGQSEAERKEKIYYLLETVGFTEPKKIYNRYPHEFSGGQRQRICIARTLAIEPKFVICDESVSALDVSVQAQVLNLLNDLKERFNLTYIFISHNLAVVKFMSDRIIVMNQGKIEETDYAEEIYEKQKTEYTKKLIASIPKGTLEDILKAQQKRRWFLESKLNKKK
ncbi:MAG: ABC transporter ATP-binding protein [Microscillaceae bacterium]|nr:ABC transporter ATP-binding protein [Microscillaceae bacterium]MDW8461874.1 ABC transporter ATP-binding protein [Cytophagales bacterium]